jgi:hypothetical protein
VLAGASEAVGEEQGGATQPLAVGVGPDDGKSGRLAVSSRRKGGGGELATATQTMGSWGADGP